jgi:hypothetical protein
MPGRRNSELSQSKNYEINKKHSGSIDGLSSKPFRVEVISSDGGSDSVEGAEIGSK